MRNKAYALLAAVAGIFMIVGGFVTLNNDEVTCGSQVMREGSTCSETSRRGGSTTERSMEEQRSDNTRTGWLLLGFGALMAVGGGLWAVSEFKPKRPKTAPGQQYPPQQYPGYPPQAQQQWPQQQQYPQQQYPQGYPQQGYPQGYPQQPGQPPQYPQQQPGYPSQQYPPQG